MQTENIFELIPTEIDDEVVDLLVQNNKVTIERIISKGHASPGHEPSDTSWYDQEKDEWVLVLKGEAVISFIDGNDIKMKTGDYTTISAHKKHRVKWTDPDSETIWLAIHY